MVTTNEEPVDPVKKIMSELDRRRAKEYALGVGAKRAAKYVDVAKHRARFQALDDLAEWIRSTLR